MIIREIKMRAVFFAVLGLVAALAPATATQCYVSPVTIRDEWLTMEQTCYNMMRKQIQEEVAASIQYLAMGAYFSIDTVNRPGFAKLFFDAATEEREHATKLIDYLLMRGKLTGSVTDLITYRAPANTSWESGASALEHALKLESDVTNSIREVIKTCESSFNDYHLVDYLSGEFLDEQYKGQRDLAGKASTLKKMMDKHAALGEFIFDKKLLGLNV